MLAIESNPDSHESGENSYTEDFSSEEKSCEKHQMCLDDLDSQTDEFILQNTLLSEFSSLLRIPRWKE